MFMISKCNNPLSPILVVLMMLFVASPLVRAEREMTAAEVWALLPKGIDSEDENQVMAYRRLVEQGESAYEAMLAVVRECDDSMIASRARYLGRRGGQRALEALEQVQGRDANKRVNEEIGKAIASIESRLAVQNADESSPLPMTGP